MTKSLQEKTCWARRAYRPAVSADTAGGVKAMALAVDDVARAVQEWVGQVRR